MSHVSHVVNSRYNLRAQTVSIPRLSRQQLTSRQSIWIQLCRGKRRVISGDFRRHECDPSSAQLWRTVISNILTQLLTLDSTVKLYHVSCQQQLTILLNAHCMSCPLWTVISFFDITVHTVIDCRPTCQHREDCVCWSLCISALKTVDSKLQYDQSVLPTISLVCTVFSWC